MNDYQRVERIIGYLEEHRAEQPNLASVAKHAGLSQFHLHRMFTRWAGITPKAFLQSLNFSHAKARLLSGHSVLDTALETGLSGPSRLHDLCLTLEAATPGEIKSGGAAWTIRLGFAATPFGTCLIGENGRGICHLSFVSDVSRRNAEHKIAMDWPQATVQWNDALAENRIADVFDPSSSEQSSAPLRAIVRGTEFQLRVWRALLAIPTGDLASYSQVAAAIGRPSATRSVASAIAKNQIAYLIPCHRVIRQTGVVGEYRWGGQRKQAMIAWEHAKHKDGHDQHKDSQKPTPRSSARSV